MSHRGQGFSGRLLGTGNLLPVARRAFNLGSIVGLRVESGNSQFFHEVFGIVHTLVNWRLLFIPPSKDRVVYAAFKR